MSGLTITEEEFMGMKQKEQNLVLFKNINEIKRSISGYKFYYRLTMVIGSVLVAGMAILFKLQLFGG